MLSSPFSSLSSLEISKIKGFDHLISNENISEETISKSSIIKQTSSSTHPQPPPLSSHSPYSRFPFPHTPPPFPPFLSSSHHSANSQDHLTKNPNAILQMKMVRSLICSGEGRRERWSFWIIGRAIGRRRRNERKQKSRAVEG